MRKYQTNLGAPVALRLIGVHAADPDLRDHGTAVVLYSQQASVPGDVAITVLGVDPATFDRYAYTTSGQRHDVSLLTAAGTAGPRPAILVHAPSGLHPAQVRIGASTVPVHVVARSDVFPGLRNGFQPMVVVDRAALARIDPSVDRANEAWTTPAGVAPLSRSIRADGFSILAELTPQIRVDNGGLLPTTWIFGYLRALAVLVGAVAVAGLVFALNARTRRRTVAYVMSRRMGLGRRAHLRSLLVELTAIVGIGWLLGTALGVAGYVAITGSLDVQPQLPPGAALDLPGGTLALTAAVAAAVIVLAALGSHAAAEHADPAEILRLE